MSRQQENDYTKAFWKAFERTGSITAYILYKDQKKKAVKEKKESKIKKQ